MTDTFTIDTESITTRRRAAAIADAAVSEGCQALDFSAVTFVSRSVADEFIDQATTHDIELHGCSGDVDQMFEMVTDRNPPFSASG